MPFLELRNVCKGFGAGSRRMQVLADVNLSVEEGEFVAIVGYSGSGKSTLMSMMSGLLRPDTGDVVLEGKTVTGPGPERAVVFQNYSLLPWMSVSENVMLSVEQAFPKMSAERRRLHVERYVEMVNLTPARDKRPSELSGGMRQRVSLARALATDPRVLLMDEPLGALDALTRATLQDEVERLWRATRKTVVMITNDVDEGILLADRIIPLSAGPGATLGPATVIDIDRPRDRTAVNHSPRFKEIRREIFSYLLGTGKRAATTRSMDLKLPDLKPIELRHSLPIGLRLGEKPRFQKRGQLKVRAR